MRAAIRSLLVVISITVTVFAGRTGVTLMAVNSAGDSVGIAAVLPMRGAVVGWRIRW
ncbi:hypothetical protein NIIDMKKI_58630 [Mycobacterium kansasii]|uniref:Uncharacterized protein n=1 Tax=Mycobacterium kansasii TaxID=1768 RepID=A0A7G1IIE7_MYCKA|nr:hypothetical protein NIIDMKKI_58630 [Mycobacterium kansasii]